MEYIITFKNTHFAIKAERCLLEHDLHIGVIPLPSLISAGCGISLLVKPDEIKRALKILADEQIDDIGVFTRITENGSYSYAEGAM